MKSLTEGRLVIYLNYLVGKVEEVIRFRPKEKEA